MSIITIVCPLCFALITLYKLCIIDLQVQLLPNKWVASFALLGISYNLLTQFYFTHPLSILYAAIGAIALLLAIRFIANHLYKQDTLGLGDVKLMGAAGIWLGLDYIFLAISLGAFLGLLHGVIYGLYKQHKTGEKTDFGQLAIPAGPGLIAGIIICAAFKFQQLPEFLGLL